MCSLPHLRQLVLQEGFEKVQQSGKFELPPELVQLEQVGLQQAAALDAARSRRIQAITEASLGSLPSMRSVSGYPGRRFSEGEPSKYPLQFGGPVMLALLLLWDLGHVVCRPSW